jgi:hypothetical protein
MNLYKINTLILFIVLILGSGLLRAQVLVNIGSEFTPLNNSDNLTALTNGAIVQFGYYTNPTTDDPFGGTFVALTSNGGSTPTTVVGVAQDADGNDTAAPDGLFVYASLNLEIAANSIPDGTVMAFKIFNGNSVSTSSYYGTAVDPDSLWNSNAQSPQDFFLDDPDVAWKGGSTAADYTSISINSAALSTPEPATLPLLAGGLVLLAWWRRTRIHRA